MDDDKTSGSYYTPFELVEFMVDYLKKEHQNFSQVLEPSAGDGRFLLPLLSCSNYVDAMELFQEKVNEINQKYSNDRLLVKKDNFIDCAINSGKRYSLIIGNPPYINLTVMEKDEIAKARRLCKFGWNYFFCITYGVFTSTVCRKTEDVFGKGIQYNSYYCISSKNF